MKTYVVATIKSWNAAAFHRRTPPLPGVWHLIERREDLTAERLAAINPRYVFFPHWSWVVPLEVRQVAECVCFHMTDVPYGRGGSPLQNLIVRGHDKTKLSALRMVDELDAGPIYAQCTLDLSGRAQEIYERAADHVYDLIGTIVRNEPAPAPQDGSPTVFRRRHPEQSRIPESTKLSQLYDHIRMLDAETYPLGFVETGGYRMEFRRPELKDDALHAQVVITRSDRAS
jgi:methionyl-tRNA formyltransferase